MKKQTITKETTVKQEQNQQQTLKSPIPFTYTNPYPKSTSSFIKIFSFCLVLLLFILSEISNHQFYFGT